MLRRTRQRPPDPPMVDTASPRGRESRGPRACRGRASRSRLRARVLERRPALPARAPQSAKVRRHARCGRGRPRSRPAAPRTRRVTARKRSRRCRSDAKSCGAKLGERRDAAPQQSVRPRAMDDRDVVAREHADLLGVDLDAVRCDDAWVEQACSGKPPDPALAVRVDEQRLDRLHRPLACDQPVELVLALVEVRHRPARRAPGRRRTPRSSRCRARAARRRSGLDPRERA